MLNAVVMQFPLMNAMHKHEKKKHHA